MIWQDKGYLLIKNKYNENSVIAEFFTKQHGKSTGIIFGASSKKIKNYLIIGNKFYINFNSKNDNKIGYYKIEIDKILTPEYFDNKLKLYCIIYSMDLLKLLTVENQENINIYYLINDFFKILKNKNWIKNFIYWELQILKNLGYDLNFKDYTSTEKINGIDTYLVKSSTTNKVIPYFLIDKDKDAKNKNELLSGLKIVGDFLNKTILQPNNIRFPNSRVEFVNLIK